MNLSISNAPVLESYRICVLRSYSDMYMNVRPQSVFQGDTHAFDHIYLS